MNHQANHNASGILVIYGLSHALGLAPLAQNGFTSVSLILEVIGLLSIAVFIIAVLYTLYKPAATPPTPSTLENDDKPRTSGDWAALIAVMEEQSRTGDLSLRAPVDPTSEVGQVAAQYNRVIEALQLARTHTRAIVECAMDGIITFSGQTLLIETVNPAVETIFGWSASELVGQPITQIINGFDTPTLNQFLATAVTDHFPYEIVGRKRDGSTFPLELVVTITRSQTEPLYVATFHDITTRKKREAEKESVSLALSESEQKYRQLVNNMHDGMFILQNGRITFVNRALLKMLGYSENEMLGKHFTELLTPESAQLLQTYYQAIAKGETVPSEFEATLYHKDRRNVIIFQLKVTLNIEDGRIMQTGTAANITEQRKYEVALEDARAIAEAANRAKSVFLANMSHELRTPLNAIIGYSEMLIEEAEEQDNEVFTPDLNKIFHAGKHLLNLINDILDLSKIEADKIELYLEDFDPADLARDVAATIEPLLQKNNNTLTLSFGPQIGQMHSDMVRVRQILFNLLSNATKFTKNGGITLRVSRLSADQINVILPSKAPEYLLFAIEDEGIGISPAQMEHLFQPFMQADASTTRNYEGTGLGLVICRRFANMMGGEVLVESALGEGSTFTVYLPATLVLPKAPTPNEPSPTAVDPATTPGDNRPIVLVIDDDPVTRDLLFRAISKEGYRVFTATSGEEGLHLAAHLRPAVITLDIMMPNVDGWTILTKLKADPQLADIPVVIATMLENRSLGFALGAVDYLVKPIDRSRLLAILDKYRPFPVPPGTASGPSVLVVEDDPVTRDLFCRTLEKEGWQVSAAVNGRYALEQLQTQTPSLILLDLMMPEMDGFQFLEAIREHPQWQKIPVVVVTAKELSAHDRAQLNGYVQKIVQKGVINLDELVQQIAGFAKDFAP